MARGYAGKFLEANLSEEKMQDIRFKDEVLETYLGGRGLAAKVLMDRLASKWSEVDPLGPENILMALTGPMTGIFPGCRTCYTGKSPMSNGMVGSTASSEFGNQLKTAGYDGIIVTGKASHPVYILVTDNCGEIRDATHLWGLDGEKTLQQLNQQVSEELTRRHPRTGLWREPGLIYIGPAGENLVRNAAIMTKLSHAAGYGGYGSVMGSKNLKAIAVIGTGQFPQVHDVEKVKQLMMQVHDWTSHREIYSTRTGTGYGGYSTGFEMSSEPVRNWQEEWHNERSYGGPRFETRYWVKKRWSDFNCSRGCMKVSCIKTGKWKGDITDNPDYELQAFLGPNLGIFDPEANIHLSKVIDNLGYSGIGFPATMGFAAELFQRGILKEEEIGFPLKWGDVEAFENLAYMTARREGIGNILADGVYRAALKIGEMKKMDVLKYAVHSKGIEIGAHGTRSDADFLAHDIGYAVSVEGGNHTSLANDGYNEHSRSVFSDSAVYCNFAILRLPQETIFEYLKAITGYDISIEEWRRVNGRRIITIQRALLLLGGPDVFWKPLEDDENPPRFYEPLQSGPWKGVTTNKEKVVQRRQAYFKALGWDEKGIPTTETLRELNISELEHPVETLR
ncbi:aldehyde ferredoxin oxidoreductase [Candidatus Bathyarchaeota archaeon]|nr:aldehyde ferredoxin oxidoreductase [Candidatus Bathyarchaeota archaeon]